MQDKWKKNIKSRMQSREISPSPEVWGELEKQLDKNKKKPFSIIWWFSGVAAGILLLLTISVFIRNSERVQALPFDDNTITRIPSQEDKNYLKKETKISIEKNEDKLLSSSNEKGRKEEQSFVVSSSPIENSIYEDKKLSEEVSPNEDILNKVLLQEDTPEILEKSDTQYVTAQELLASVEAEIAKGDTITEIKIDSKELLGEIENEIVEDKYPSLLDQFSKEVKKAQVVLREKIMN